MKRLFLAVICISSTFLIAQNDIDVMRYSQTGIGGDARFMALGGSMGALGANISCINYNPAGIALYRKGEAIFSGNMQFARVNSEHYGSNAVDSKTSMNLGCIGYASSVEEPSPYRDEHSKKRFKDWSRRHTIAFSYNKLASFKNNITIQGVTHGQTIIDDFLSSAQGTYPTELNAYYEKLAFNTYLIDTFPGYPTEYGTYFYTDKSFKQTKSMNITGGINEYSFAYGYAIDNKNYLGASIGIPSGKWNYTSQYTEEDYGDSTEYFQSLTMNEALQTRAIGINLKVGGISRINENVRIGGYVHTPTVYSLSDTYSAGITANYDSIFYPSYNDSAATGNFRYKINSPLKAGANFCYIYEKILAFNLDAEFVNYPQSSLSAKGYVFTDVNTAIRKKYKSTANIRMGVELNTSPVVFRLGFASYGSPLGNMLTGKNVKNSFSAGIGFRENDKHFFDISLVYNHYSTDYYLYSPDFIKSTSLKYNTTLIMVTYGIRLN